MVSPQRYMRLPCDMACEIKQNEDIVQGVVTNTSFAGLNITVEGRFPFTGVVSVSLVTMGISFDAEVRWRRLQCAGLRVLRTGEISSQPPFY